MHRAIKLAFLFFACCAAVAQSNQFRPTLVQSSSAELDTSTTTMRFLDDATSGNTVFIFMAGNISTGITVTDTLGTSYSSTGVFSSNDGSGTARIQIDCGVFPSSGANTISTSGQTAGFDVVIAEFAGMNGCITDGTDTAFAPTTGPATASLTTHPVTSNSNDLCVSWGSNWWATSNMWSDGNTIGGDGAFKAATADYHVVGAAGTQSITYNLNLLSTPPANAWLVRTQCYTPSLTIATDALPHGVSGTLYPTLQLVSVGGSGSSRTWTKTSGTLPGGLSVNAAGQISGTPSGPVGTSTFTIQVSDGTNTASRTFSLGIGAAFATPTVVGHHAFATGPITYSATAGNLLLVTMWGQENSGSYIWTPKFAGANNVLTSTPALSFHRLYPLPGVPGNNVANGAPLSVYAACVPTTATYTLDYLVTSPSTSIQAHAQIIPVEVNGAQGAIDDGFLANIAGFSGSPGTLTTNATAQVPNTLAMLFSTYADTVNSPFSVIDNTTVGSLLMMSAFDLVGSAGSFSGTVSRACTTTCIDLAITNEIIPLRPDIAGLACGANPAGGGGGASPVRHKAQVY